MTTSEDRAQLIARMLLGDNTAARSQAVEAIKRGCRAEETLARVLRGSLLDVRRAAFAPTIGVRYGEAIRAEIANACRRLEDECREGLSDERSTRDPSRTLF